MRQVKRILTRDCESGMGGGKLVAIQGLRDTEEIVNSMLSVFYQKKTEEIIARIDNQRQPKDVIIASQNKRLEEIQDVIELNFLIDSTEPPFKFSKTYVSQAQKRESQRKEQQQNESYRTKFDVSQVFVLLDRKFLSHLIYGELDISEVDYLIFDEVHFIYPESTYVDIMNKFIFNHKLMQPPPSQPKDQRRLPKVFAFFNLESVLQAAQYKDQSIMNKFYFMANTFNASLLCFQKHELVQVQRDIVRDFSQSRVRNIQSISNLSQQFQISNEFIQKTRKYISFRKDGKNRVACFTQSIIEEKNLQQYLFSEKLFAKITLDEALHVLEELGKKELENQHQQIDQQKNLNKPILESAQSLFNKVRYFSSHIQFNDPGNVKNFANQIAISCHNDKSGNKISWLFSPRIYLKKTQSESQAVLEMCKTLFSLGYLDQYLRPSLIKQSSQQLKHLEEPQSRSEDQKYDEASDDKQPQDEEEKTSFIGNSKTTRCPGSEYCSSDKSTQNLRSDSISQKSNNLTNFDFQLLPRVCNINILNNQEVGDANEFFFGKNKSNKEKLQTGQQSGQHHIAVMQYNTNQLELFIQHILNPILKALNQYNELCDSQRTPDLIRLDDLNVNMISESSIKDLLCQECFYEKQEKRKVNHTFIQFKNYRQRMFNIYDKNNDQRNYQEYPYLVKMIDQFLERYKFPHYMTQHIENYHSQVRGKSSQSAPKLREDINRKTFLTMLMIALSDKEPTTMELEKVKNEMGRLAFVGDSIIILCQVMTMIFSGKKSFSEKDLDAVKNQTVKNEKLKQRAQSVGLDNLRIKANYCQKTSSNPEIEFQQNARDLGDVIKSLAGLFSIYLGFGAAYLLLSDFGIIEPPTSDQMIKMGEISVAQKVEILKTISQNRKDLLDYEREKKRHLFEMLSNQQYPGFYEDPLTGTEIVEVWKKLVKSRGLYMKQQEDLAKDDTAPIFHAKEKKEIKQIDQQSLLRDESISTSLMNKSSNCCRSDKDSPDKHIDNLFDASPEELKEYVIDNAQMQAMQALYATAIAPVTLSVSSYPMKRISKNEEFERGYKESHQEGYEFKNQEILLQSIVHKSYSEKLWNSGTKFKDSSLIEKDIIMQYNLQILEYLGDSILNFTISKLFYCETANNKEDWHGDFFIPTKLHELKTWFSSNNWLSFALYENYYCTITEEIPRDPQFQNSKFAQRAQESINQLQKQNISENEGIKFAPRVPLIYDQNDRFEEQINDFNGVCFRQCLATDKNKDEKLDNFPREGLNVTSKSLTLKLFKDKDVQQQNQNEVDFSEIDEKFVKYFSDVIEALIGGIFMDSGDLDKTQMILLKLINCPSVSSFPIVQHDRTAVLSVFNSKPYCKGIKLYHTLEDKDDCTYIMGYMGKLQFRRLKYSKERKKKVLLFYYDMRLYLEEAYKIFEMKFVKEKKEDEKRQPTNDDNDNDDNKGNIPTNDEWLEFNKDYRKTWKVTVYSADQKRYSAIKEAAKNLYKFVSSAEENFKTRQNQNIPDMRVQIILYLNEGLHTIGIHPKNSLLVLESERVQSSRIRELLQICDIKFIDCLSYNMKDVGNFIHKLNNRQVQQFYERLIEFGKA